MNSIKLIKELNSRMKSSLRRDFNLSASGAYFFEIEGTEKALNRIGQENEEVCVWKWFEDIWLYMSVTFKKVGKEVEPFTSLSFFQKVDNSFYQLFRAEWDRYANIGESNHPQPHWHITSNLALEKDLKDFVEDVEKEEESNAGLFSELIQENRDITIDVHRMHFAMAGEWPDTGNMVNSIIDEERFISWIANLLNHVRKELEYVKG